MDTQATPIEAVVATPAPVEAAPAEPTLAETAPADVAPIDTHDIDPQLIADSGIDPSRVFCARPLSAPTRWYWAIRGRRVGIFRSW